MVRSVSVFLITSLFGSPAFAAGYVKMACVFYNVQNGDRIEASSEYLTNDQNGRSAAVTDLTLEATTKSGASRFADPKSMVYDPTRVFKIGTMSIQTNRVQFTIEAKDRGGSTLTIFHNEGKEDESFLQLTLKPDGPRPGYSAIADGKCRYH